MGARQGRDCKGKGENISGGAFHGRKGVLCDRYPPCRGVCFLTGRGVKLLLIDVFLTMKLSYDGVLIHRSIRTQGVSCKKK